MKNTLCICFGMVALMTGSLQAAPVLVLNPASGAVAGLPGSTVGWGFTLTNNDPNYLVVTQTSFTPAPLAAFGLYRDLLANRPDFVVVGPGSPSVTEAFNQLAMTGIGAFDINPTAAFRSVNGTIVLNYSLYSRSPNDPDFNPDTDLLASDRSVSAPATVNIVPEPATFVLLLTAALPLGVAAIRRRLRQ